MDPLEFQEVEPIESEQELFHFEEKPAEIKPKLCQKCRAFSPSDNNKFCSSCTVEIVYEPLIDEMSLDELEEIPHSEFKRTVYDRRLVDIYNAYKNDNNLHHRLLSNNEFKQLQILCQNKTSGAIFKILDGLTDFPATILYAKQANKLFDKILEEHPDDKNPYKYIHCICSFVIDPWNLRDDLSVLVCYYKETGYLSKCPNNIEKIHTIWKNIKIQWGRHNISGEPIYNCPTCDITVFTDQKWLRCKYCHWPHHTDCAVNQYNAGMLKCYKCRKTLHLQSVDKNQNCGDMYII